MRQFWIGVAVAILQRAGQRLFDRIWSHVIVAIEHAEAEWREPEAGEARKEEVLEKVEKFLKRNKVTNFFNNWVVMRYLEYFIDESIKELNSLLGHCWIKRAEEARQILLKRIPFIR